MAPYSGLVHVLESGCDCVVLACEVFYVYLQILPSYPTPPMCTFKHSPPPLLPQCVPSNTPPPPPDVCPVGLCRQKLLLGSSSSSELPGPSLLERGSAAPGGAGSRGGDGRYVGMKSLVIATVSWNSCSVCCNHMSAM